MMDLISHQANDIHQQRHNDNVRAVEQQRLAQRVPGEPRANPATAAWGAIITALLALAVRFYGFSKIRSTRLWAKPQAIPGRTAPSNG